MKKQPYPVLDLTGGLHVSKDPYFLLDKENPKLLNIRYDQGLLRKDVGLLAFSDDLPLAGIPMFIDTFYLDNGTAYLLIATTLFVYYYDVTNDYFIPKNPYTAVTHTHAMALTISNDIVTMSMLAGDFAAEGFAVGMYITTSIENFYGPFLITEIVNEVMYATDIRQKGTRFVVPQTYTITEITPFTGNRDYPFSAVATIDSAGDNVYFLTNGVDAVMRWEGGATQFALVSPNIYAKQLAVFKNRLILGNVTDTGTSVPRRVQWSVLADPDDFAGTGSGFIEMVDTPDWIISLVAFKDKLFVIKERSIWELAYVGGTTYFIPILKQDGVGTVAADSCFSLGEDIIFFGNDNIYLYNGLSLQSIGDQLFSMLYDTERKIINTGYINRCTGAYIEELEEYWISFPAIGDYSSILLKYNFKHKAWSMKYTAATCIGFYQIVPSDTWDDLTGNWSAQAWAWMVRNLPTNAPTTLIGTDDGNIWEDDRLTKTTDRMIIETKDFLFAHAQRWLEFRVLAKGGTFTISYSIDQGVTWSDPVTCVGGDAYETHVMYFNITSQSIRCKIESVDEDLTIKWIEPWFIPRGRIKEVITGI